MFASKVLMIRPASFGFNPETGTTNAFQKNVNIQNANEAALKEFDAFVNVLLENGIEVIVFNDTADPAKPDAIFPNNWFSTHKNKLILYPMLTKSRRAEIRADVVEHLLNSGGVEKELLDFSSRVNDNQFLEGTGSFVFDHANKLAYLARSQRSDELLAFEVCKDLGYELIAFDAKDKSGLPVYHTNVIMCLGDKFCVICGESILQKELVYERLNYSGKEIIEIIYDEMEHFAGNMLLLKNSRNEPVLVMSDSAFKRLSQKKLTKLKAYAHVIHPEISTIETLGGGSVRCMLAEIF
jgi:hypothetical protein